MKLNYFSLIMVAICLVGCSTLPRSERIKTTDATHSYVLGGSGYPTVVLESGLGNGKESWGPVYEEISKFTQVVAYDRAGYGRSRSKNRSRDGATIVQELRLLLRGLELDPPYILVGHSLGGTYMELYARSYPEEVAGVILVDSRHADFTRQCQLANAGICSPPAVLSALMANGPKREVASLDETMGEVMRLEPFPNVPLVVLASGKNLMMGAKFQKVWLETQQSLATFSEDSTYRVCKDCGHFIQNDAPALVVDAVKSVIEKVPSR